MAVLNAGFELGVAGATVAAADAGDGDAWDVVTVGTAAALVYDTTHVALGAQAAKVATGASAVTCFCAWGFVAGGGKLGTQTDHYGRVYYYFSGNPGAVLTIARALSGGSIACSIQLTTAGKLQLADQANTVQATSTNAIATGQWIRVEYHFVHSTTVGQLELKLFNTATSGTATETLTTSANLNTLASANIIRFGVCASLANVAAFWIDQIQAGASAYPGAAPVGKPCRALLGVG